MNNLFNLQGKKGIVTGGTRGIGKTIAQGLHDAGVELVIMGTTDKIYNVAKEMSTDEVKVHGIVADFIDIANVEQGFNDAIKILGDLDILINNAGTQIRNKSEDYQLEDWNKILNVNLTSVFVLSQLAGRVMLQKGSGRIINIASVLSFIGGYTAPAYSASKGAIARLTQSLANEWASKGVNVNAIAPGYFDTDHTTAIKNDSVRYKQLLDRVPAGRWGIPEDIVGTVVFLSSDASDYLHGVIIPVDGGFLGR